MTDRTAADLVQPYEVILQVGFLVKLGVTEAATEVPTLVSSQVVVQPSLAEKSFTTELAAVRRFIPVITTHMSLVHIGQDFFLTDFTLDPRDVFTSLFCVSARLVWLHLVGDRRVVEQRQTQLWLENFAHVLWVRESQWKSCNS